MHNYNTDRITERRNDEISRTIIPLKFRLSYCMLYIYMYNVMTVKVTIKIHRYLFDKMSYIRVNRATRMALARSKIIKQKQQFG